MAASAKDAMNQNILAEENSDKRDELLKLLEKAYWMEIETVMNYVANSINPDGIRGREVAEELTKDIPTELQHAQQFGERIKELYGTVPGSLNFTAEQKFLQPPERQTDVLHVIRGVIEAEQGAIEHYSKMVEFCDDVDLVTQDMVITILRDEQGHLRLFQGFLREYEEMGLT